MSESLLATYTRFATNNIFLKYFSCRITPLRNIYSRLKCLYFFCPLNTEREFNSSFLFFSFTLRYKSCRSENRKRIGAAYEHRYRRDKSISSWVALNSSTMRTLKCVSMKIARLTLFLRNNRKVCYRRKTYRNKTEPFVSPTFARMLFSDRKMIDIHMVIVSIKNYLTCSCHKRNQAIKTNYCARREGKL